MGDPTPPGPWVAPLDPAINVGDNASPSPIGI